MSLAAIHILKKELELTDAEYRALLQEVAGVTSAKQLDENGDRAVMKRLYSIRDERAKADSDRPKTPTERKIWAIWFDLKRYLPQQEQTLSYLLGFVRRASGNQDIRIAADLGSLNKKQAYHAIEALKHRLEQESAAVAREVPF